LDVCLVFGVELYFSYLYPLVRYPSVLFIFSLHDALPILLVNLVISPPSFMMFDVFFAIGLMGLGLLIGVLMYLASRGVINLVTRDRKSTRLNSSHVSISYAVFCLKTKNYMLIDIVFNYSI